MLDEIEKAHPDIFNILLQVMDHATLTDNNGRKADFRHVILIMTTNAGAREMIARKLGFGFSAAPAARRAAGARQGRRSSAPSRPSSATGSTRWISFDSLPPEVIRKVVDKLVGELAGAAGREEGDDGAVAPRRATGWPSTASTPQFGARPMARLIQNELKKPLADEILFGELKGGGKVRVEVEEGKIALRYAK